MPADAAPMPTASAKALANAIDDPRERVAVRFMLSLPEGWRNKPTIQFCRYRSTIFLSQPQDYTGSDRELGAAARFARRRV
jgi:hypothetical protein